MRRGEAVLACLRRGRISAVKEQILRGGGHALRKLLRRWDLSASTRMLPLGIEATPGNIVHYQIPNPAIVDGLDGLIKLGARISARAHGKSAEFADDFPRVFRAYMIATSGGVKSLPLKISASAYVSSPDLIRIPGVRTPAMLMPSGEVKVRPLAVLPDTVPVRDATPRCRIPEGAVHDRTIKMTAYPHIRSGIDLDHMNPQEREGFMNEAENLKGIPAGQGQLLALFRNVPVEIISKARYVEENKLLLYTIDSERRLVRTRLHDMGIVRDPVAGKTHMVVHRTQFKSVSME